MMVVRTKTPAVAMAKLIKDQLFVINYFNLATTGSVSSWCRLMSTL